MNHSIEDKINLLRKTIEYHEKKYYVDNDPQISDYEFDMLVKELQELEKHHPEFVVRNRPHSVWENSPYMVLPPLNTTHLCSVWTTATASKN